MKISTILFFLAISIILNVNAYADDHHNTGATYDATEEEHHTHSNHLAIFSGLTSNMKHEHTDFSLGLDYEYRLPMWHDLIGIGLFGEVVFAEHTEYLAGIPIFLHPVGGLKFWAAPGLLMMEVADHTTEEHLFHKSNNNELFADGESTTIEQEFLIRIGFGYDFHVKNVSISPALSADIINGHLSLVYGIYFGIVF